MLRKGRKSIQLNSELCFSVFRSGILQAGDRILAINGQMLEGMTLEEARAIIKRSNHQIHLEIEFDVTGMVLPLIGMHNFILID